MTECRDMASIGGLMVVLMRAAGLMAHAAVSERWSGRMELNSKDCIATVRGMVKGH